MGLWAWWPLLSSPWSGSPLTATWLTRKMIAYSLTTKELFNPSCRWMHSWVKWQSFKLILANILSWDQDSHISFSHCHSHSGVPFNKEADWMVNAFMIHENAPHISCFGNTSSIEASNWLMMTGITAAGSQSTEATAGWKYDTRLSPSPLKSTIKRHIMTWLPTTCTKCPKSYVPLQATHPIGEYYFDWPDCFPDYGPSGIIQTCQHIKFTICSRYQKHFTSLQQWKKAKNNNGLFISFHCDSDNPSAFTFQDLPLDVH